MVTDLVTDTQGFFRAGPTFAQDFIKLGLLSEKRNPAFEVFDQGHVLETQHPADIVEGIRADQGQCGAFID